MPSKKPTTVPEYLRWLRAEQKIHLTDRDKTHYDAVINKARKDLEDSPFWRELTANLNDFDSEYRLEHGFPLLAPSGPIILYTKPYTSLVEKIFRKNVLDNAQWPNEPSGGWKLPSNWYDSINDTIRTVITVKYLDGVEFITNKLEHLARCHGQDSRVDFEAKESGYYAAHFYTYFDFDVPKMNWDTEIKRFSVEIQVTTQLQEVIRVLLHKYYESNRVMAELDPVKWQWNYKSKEFVPNYLGHILHYVEGMILEIRDRQKEGVP
jgi:ppGpp synthetase/RelA/SpoT-type nucleotidyltranferase